ncbi:hypothetical protein G4B88_012491 [Cannabis sativa]|uniref:peroxidase n=1 Tax=Cannabis sativa TaxID=3483 RepID=A0A7J6I5U8_CANSA|nr:hypothetical protein G4B88_012491 [Cannabis sativa]
MELSLSFGPFSLLFMILVFSIGNTSIIHASSDSYLTLDYYASTCPTVFEIIRKETECAVLSDPRSAALIVRLHFHDCFVQVGGPYWDVPVGRKDSITANYALADTNIPTANEGLIPIISKFMYQGLSVKDMVALAGAHTIGMARCENFRDRIYGDFRATSGLNPISASYLSSLRSICPPIHGGENNITAMDNVTPNIFDNSFYHTLLKGEGLLSSDQEMYSSMFSIQTRELVKLYATDPLAFFNQFSESMVKMGNITNSESFANGEVRKNCRFINT